ncbi:MAG: chitobiase/beta-hexosaminidase C-terminal domain-containing protein [Prevotellaceae bacterium]|jgi:hypothetical protein|nr:chitobiase/beta-hexosaminidase C-terminal domain-containing protein [Prevotellaceae bacterium]
MKKFTFILVALFATTFVFGQNLVTNGDFSAWTGSKPDGWVLDPNTTTIFSQGTPDGLVATNPTATTKIYTTVAVEASETYDLTFTYSASHARFRIWSGFVDSIPQTGGITYLGTAQTDPLRTLNGYYIAATDNTETIRFVVPADKSLFRLEYRYYTQASSSFALKNISLVKYVVPTNQVATPVISPNAGNITAPANVSITCETEGATIYYTTDGTTPDETSTEYTAAFPVSATTTVKAIATKATFTNSEVATATYTFPVEVANIAAFLALPLDTWAKITGDIIAVYHNGQNMYVTDSSDDMLVYGTIPGENATPNGTIISGATAKLGTYGGQPQAVNPISAENSVITDNPVLPTVVAMANVTTADQAKFVKIENVQFKTSGTFGTTGDAQNATLADDQVVRNNFKFTGIAYDAAKHYDITGFINYYNGALQLYFIEIEERSTEGISQIEANAIKMFAEDGVLNVVSEGGMIEVYDVLGRNVANVEANNGLTSISNLPANQMLIVKIGNKTGKIVVK